MFESEIAPSEPRRERLFFLSFRFMVGVSLPNSFRPSFGVLGLGELEFGPLLVFVPVLSGFIVHQELFPLVSLGTRLNLLCSDRLWRMEFYK